MPLVSSTSTARLAWSSGQLYLRTALRATGGGRVRELQTWSLHTPRRRFGNAPSRVRPVETPQEHALRQSEREISASIVIVIMFIVPLWLFVLSAESQEKKRDAVRAWALEQRAAHKREEETNPKD